MVDKIFNPNGKRQKSFKIICYWTASSVHTFFQFGLSSVWWKSSLDVIWHISAKSSSHALISLWKLIFSHHTIYFLFSSPSFRRRTPCGLSPSLSRLPAGSMPSDDNLFLIAFVVSTAMTRSLNPETCSPQVLGLWSNSKYQKQSD